MRLSLAPQAKRIRLLSLLTNLVSRVLMVFSRLFQAMDVSLEI
jgi:hypothetical protein